MLSASVTLGSLWLVLDKSRDPEENRKASEIIPELKAETPCDLPLGVEIIPA